MQELAQSLRDAGQESSEALGAVTRRESAVELGDTLDPVSRSVAIDEPGARFLVVDPLDADSVVGLLHLTDESAVALADLFLGGPGTGVERRLTEIETHGISRLTADVVAPIVAAATYRTLGPVRLIETSEPSGLEEFLVRVGLSLTVGSHSINASLFVADPDKVGVSGGAEARKMVTASVATMPIELEIDLAAVNMPASDVQSLATGDVIVFDVPTNAPATARHGRHRLLDGRVSNADGRRLFEVTQVRSA